MMKVLFVARLKIAWLCFFCIQGLLAYDDKLSIVRIAIEQNHYQGLNSHPILSFSAIQLLYDDQVLPSANQVMLLSSSTNDRGIVKNVVVSCDVPFVTSCESSGSSDDSHPTVTISLKQFLPFNQIKYYNIPNCCSSETITSSNHAGRSMENAVVKVYSGDQVIYQNVFHGLKPVYDFNFPTVMQSEDLTDPTVSQTVSPQTVPPTVSLTWSSGEFEPATFSPTVVVSLLPADLSPSLPPSLLPSYSSPSLLPTVLPSAKPIVTDSPTPVPSTCTPSTSPSFNPSYSLSFLPTVTPTLSPTSYNPVTSTDWFEENARIIFGVLIASIFLNGVFVGVSIYYCCNRLYIRCCSRKSYRYSEPADVELASLIDRNQPNSSTDR